MDFLLDKVKQVKEPESVPGMSLRACTEQAERDGILQALTLCGGNKSKAAHMLGIDRSRLYSKLRKYQIG